MTVSPEPLLHIALINPEIPGNTGNIGRLCMGLGARLHLVHPLGFSTDEKAVRRAGIDYWRRVDVLEHPSIEAFLGWVGQRPVHALSARASRPFTAIPWARGDVLMLGRESVGLQPELLERFPGWRIPLLNDVRSLNLANAASVVAYDGLRRLEPTLFAQEP